MEKNEILPIRYRYFFLVTNIDNALIVTCSADGNSITVFPREGEKNYFDNDITFDPPIIREFTGQLQPNIINKLSFRLFNGASTPNGSPNPVHLRYKVYREEYNNNVLVDTVEMVPFVNRYLNHQPADRLIWDDIYTVVREKDTDSYSFSLDT